MVGLVRAAGSGAARKGVGVAVCCLLLAGACGGSSEDRTEQEDEPTTDPGASEQIGEEGTPVPGGFIAMGIDSETSGWNPGVDRWATAGALVGSTMLEPLATLDGDGVAQPWLAEDWQPNDTFDEWTITIREGVTFHNGQPLDAEAVKQNLDFVIGAPLSGVAYGTLFDEVTVVDDRTVRVALTTPWGAFPSSFLSNQPALMRAPAMLEAEDLGSSNPIGTGPFRFDEWRRDSSLKVERNDEYWVEGQPYLEGIEFLVLPDTGTRAAAFDAGDIQLMFTSDAGDGNRLEASATVLRNWDVEPAAILANVRETVGGQPNPMSNLHARLAVAHALDREALAESAGEGVQVASSPFAPTNPWGQPHEENGYPDFDLAEAVEQVEAYKADTGEDELRFTLLGPADVNRAGVLQLVQEQLAAAGITVELQSMETTSLINNVVAARYQAAMFSNYTSPDPDQNHYFWSAATASEEGGVNINFTGFTNDATEAALERGRESDDPEERREAYDELIREHNANAVNLWMYYTPYSLVADDAVRGLRAVSELPFANYQPKTWWGGIWLAQD